MRTIHILFSLLAFAVLAPRASAQSWDTPQDTGCKSEGHRGYSSVLRDIPHGWDWAETCRTTPFTLGAHTVYASKCVQNVWTLGAMWGEFEVPDVTCSKNHEPACTTDGDDGVTRISCCSGFHIASHDALQHCNFEVVEHCGHYLKKKPFGNPEDVVPECLGSCGIAMHTNTPSVNMLCAPVHTGGDATQDCLDADSCIARHYDDFVPGYVSQCGNEAKAAMDDTVNGYLTDVVWLVVTHNMAPGVGFVLRKLITTLEECSMDDPWSVPGPRSPYDT